jgi:hypothetical protein
MYGANSLLREQENASHTSFPSDMHVCGWAPLRLRVCCDMTNSTKHNPGRIRIDPSCFKVDVQEETQDVVQIDTSHMKRLRCDGPIFPCFFVPEGGGHEFPVHETPIEDIWVTLRFS